MISGSFITQGLRIGPTGSQQEINGPLEGINTISDIVNKLTQFLVPLAAVILFFILVWGGIGFILSRGDPEKVKSARAKLTAGIVGFILLIASYLIVKLISSMFGLGGGII